jgi:hypothetical protein
MKRMQEPVGGSGRQRAPTTRAVTVSQSWSKWMGPASWMIEVMTVASQSVSASHAAVRPSQTHLTTIVTIVWGPREFRKTIRYGSFYTETPCGRGVDAWLIEHLIYHVYN